MAKLTISQVECARRDLYEMGNKVDYVEVLRKRVVEAGLFSSDSSHALQLVLQSAQMLIQKELGEFDDRAKELRL